MKKTALALATLVLLFAWAPSHAWSQAKAPSLQAFQSIVDFSVSIKDVASAASTGKVPSIGRLFLLDGTIGSIVNRTPEGGGFLCYVELVSGSWVGSSAVVLHRVYIEFSGDAYMPFFTKGEDGYLAPGTRLLALCSFDSFREGFIDKARTAFLSGIQFRVLE